METIEMDGVEYLKASAAAKKFGYTSDYVGQLCRSGKIRAKLIGRTWFVDPASVEEHQSKKYQSDEDEDVSASKTKTSRQSVKVKISNKAVTSLHTQKLNHQRNSRTLNVSYDKDESDLLPKMTSSPSRSTDSPQRTSSRTSKSVVIRHIDAKNVPIESKKKHTKFIANELPEVSLSGSLQVMDVSAEEIEDHEAADAPHPVISPTKSHPVVAMTRKRASRRQAALSSDEPAPTSNSERSQRGVVNSFTPSTVAVVERPRFALRFAPVIATAVAVLCVGLVFSASSMVVSSQGSLDSSVVFQAANLLDLLSR